MVVNLLEITTNKIISYNHDYQNVWFISLINDTTLPN